MSCGLDDHDDALLREALAIEPWCGSAAALT
jgi:hypothetical protein